MNIGLKSVFIENFKGIKSLHIDFADKVKIKGRNASGKTSVVDAVLWLLFGKDSNYASDFGVRPVDADGNTVHFIDITVKAIFDIDGTEHELCKTQKENWVKPRGEETSVFKGNVNSFEIDGYPRLDKEYKDFVAGLADEEMFKILTSPTYFPSMPWKKQREILMLFANEEKDVDLATRLGGFDELIDELSKAPKTDDILAKYKKAKKDLETRLKELPVRIDEISKSKVDYDLAELELAKRELEERLNANVGRADIGELQGKFLDAEMALNKYVTAMNSDHIARRRDAEKKRADLDCCISKAKQLVADCEERLGRLNEKKSALETEKNGLGDKYFALSDATFDSSKWVFDESSTICSLCGQKLPANKIDELKATFAKRKADAETEFNNAKKKELDVLKTRGVEINNQITSIIEQIGVVKSELETARTSVESQEKYVPVFIADCEKYLHDVDLTGDPEYTRLLAERDAVSKELETAKTDSVKLSNASAEIKAELSEVERKLNAVYGNEKIDGRIDELKAEQRETSQKIADCEKMIYLTETFIRAKLDAITSSINGTFKNVTFKLFDTQINGGMSECCECCVNGVPYSDVNSAGKIQAGLDIINTLSEYYDKHAPIFIDNRESCTDIPEMATQIISLYVDPTYKELTVETE